MYNQCNRLRWRVIPALIPMPWQPTAAPSKFCKGKMSLKKCEKHEAQNIWSIPKLIKCSLTGCPCNQSQNDGVWNDHGELSAARRQSQLLPYGHLQPSRYLWRHWLPHWRDWATGTGSLKTYNTNTCYCVPGWIEFCCECNGKSLIPLLQSHIKIVWFKKWQNENI